MPGTVLGPGDMVMTKMHINSCLRGVDILLERRQVWHMSCGWGLAIVTERERWDGELRGLQFEEDGQGSQKEVRDGANGMSGEILCDPPSRCSSRKRRTKYGLSPWCLLHGFFCKVNWLSCRVCALLLVPRWLFQNWDRVVLFLFLPLLLLFYFFVPSSF